MRTRLLLAGLIAIPTFPLLASGSDLPQLRSAVGANVRTEARPATGTARFVQVDQGIDLAPLQARNASGTSKANAFFAGYGNLFGIRNAAEELEETAAIVEVDLEALREVLRLDDSRRWRRLDEGGRLRAGVGHAGFDPGGRQGEDSIPKAHGRQGQGQGGERRAGDYPFRAKPPTKVDPVLPVGVGASSMSSRTDFAARPQEGR